MPLIHLPNGKAFTAGDGETLLDAGLRAGITLPYSCRTGRCSACRCRVSTGTTTALKPEIGLTSAELASGWVLGCVRSATSDVALDVEDLGILPPARTLPCRIAQIDKLAYDVLRVVLRLPPAAVFDYRPGQYVDVIGPGGIRRSYSIANAASADRQLELHIRAVKAGAMSAYWFAQARHNDLLRLHGPLGTFFVRDVAGLHLVFLATGTGIAPVKAAVEGLPLLSPDQAPRSVSVYWGCRHASDLYWTPGPAFEGVRFVRVLSRGDASWDGARGHVQDVFAATAPDLARTAIYACGSDAMIHAARALLVGAGLPERRFSSDAFVCSAAAEPQGGTT